MRNKKNFFYILFSFLLMALFILPLLWMLYASLVDGDANLSTSIFNFSKYTTSNYFAILEKSDMLRWAFNSLFITSSIVVLNIVIGLCAAYAMARLEFKGKKLTLIYVVFVMMVPAQILIIPTFLMINKFHMVNSYLGLIIPFAANPFSIFIFRQYYLSFPKEFEEAARIDGCSEFTILTKVVVPLSKNVITTLAIVLFIWNFNAFIYPSILIKNPDLYTIPMGVAQLTNSQYLPNVAQQMAGATLGLLPILIFYIVFQRKIIYNDTSSGIK